MTQAWWGPGYKPTKKKITRNKQLYLRWKSGASVDALASEFQLSAVTVINLLYTERRRLGVKRPQNKEKAERNREIVMLRDQGFTYAALAEVFGIKWQAVAGIVERHKQRHNPRHSASKRRA